jgi:hypothetical protein
MVVAEVEEDGKKKWVLIYDGENCFLDKRNRDDKTWMQRMLYQLSLL